MIPSRDICHTQTAQVENLVPESLRPWKQLLAERWLYVLTSACLLGTMLAYQWSPSYHLDLASRLESLLLEGFYPAEHTSAGPYRWTGARADIRVPNLWPGQGATLTLILSAPRQDEPDAAKRETPVTAELAVNGRPIAELPMNPGPTEYTFDIGPDVIGPTGNLFTTLRSPTFAPPNDLRPLGLIVGGVEAVPAGRAPHLPPLETTLSLTVLTGFAYLWLRRLGAGIGWAIGTGGILSAVAVVGLFAARPFVTPLSNRLLLLVAVACLSCELTRWLGGGLDVRLYRRISIIFLAAFAIRLVLAHTPGDHDNFIAFKMMLENVTTRGVAAAYEIDPVIGAYPPVHHYDLALVGHLYRTLVSPEFDVASRRLNFAMKQPTIMLDMLILVVILAYTLRQDRPRAAPIIGAAYAFNPGIIYTCAYNGQLGDPLYSLFIVASMAALLLGQGVAMGSAGALGILTKPQAIAFFPFLALAAVRHLSRRELVRTVVAASAVSLIVLTPFLAAGTIGHMIRTVSTTVGHGPRIASNTLNIWWLYSLGKAWEIKDTGQLFGPITFRAAGLALFFGCAYGLVAWKTWTVRKAGDLALLGAFVGMAFFMLPTEIHENYLFPVFGLLALAAVHTRRAWLLTGILSATWFVNMISFDQTLMGPLGQAVPIFMAIRLPLQLTLASINVAVLLIWTYWVFRMPSAPDERENPSNVSRMYMPAK
jgi:Gpi18-like mannosyltransferase